MKTLISVVVSVILVASGFAFAKNSDGEVRTLIEKKCGLCHTPDYALGSRNTAEGWLKTVMRMREDNGANLTDQETELIVDYLVKNCGR